MAWNRALIGFVLGVCCYGGVALIVLVMAAFVFGTGDFSQWGVSGRAATTVMIAISEMFAAIPLEAAEVRKNLTNALSDHLSGNDHD